MISPNAQGSYPFDQVPSDAPLVVPSVPTESRTESLKWYHEYDEDIQRILERWDKKLTPFGRDRIRDWLDITLNKNLFMSFFTTSEFRRTMLEIAVTIYAELIAEHKRFGLSDTEAIHFANLLILAIESSLRRAIGGRERDLTFKSYQHVTHQQIYSGEEEKERRGGFFSKIFGGEM